MSPMPMEEEEERSLINGSTYVSHADGGNMAPAPCALGALLLCLFCFKVARWCCLY